MISNVRLKDLELIGTGEPQKVLEEGRDRSEISFRHDFVEGCLERINRRQETREEVCGVLWRC